MTVWQQHLETVGAEFFQRYRKRLLAPWIALEIHRDYPGLSFLDVLIRVRAGRCIIRERDDFRALEAIRSGRWQDTMRLREEQRREHGVRNAAPSV